MTNRDPNVPDFIGKLNDYYDCLKDYFKMSDINKLRNDQTRPDIELVCYYDKKQLIDLSRQYGLNYNDFIKMNPRDEKEFLKDIYPQKYNLNH